MHRLQQRIKPRHVMTKQEGRCTADTLPIPQYSCAEDPAYVRPSLSLYTTHVIDPRRRFYPDVRIFMATSALHEHRWPRPFTFQRRARASGGLPKSTQLPTSILIDAQALHGLKASS